MKKIQLAVSGFEDREEDQKAKECRGSSEAGNSLQLTATNNSFKAIMLSSISQSEKDKYSRISFICGM